MISFACKEIDFKELIRCSFNLNKTDYQVLDFLMKNNGEFTIEELSKKLSLERSGVQKAIKTLIERELVFRKQKNLGRGGYQFYYFVKDRDEIKSRVEKTIDGWHRKVKEEIKGWV